MDLDALSKAYEARYGRAERVLTFFLDENGESSQIDVMLDLAEEDEGRPATTAITIGAALRSRDQNCEPVELAIDVRGNQSSGEYEQLGEGLIHVVREWIGHGVCPAPNMLLSGVIIPPFIGMNCSLVMDLGHHFAEWLETDPPVRLLEIVPLFQNEKDSLERLPARSRTMVAVRANVQWNDPERRQVDIVIEATTNVWDQIAAWYKVNAPKVHERLKPGATEDDIRSLESALGHPLPDELRSSLMKHNGGLRVGDFVHLSAESIGRRWTMMNELRESGAFSSRQVADRTRDSGIEEWWDARWIPFAEDSGGNLVCLNAPSASAELPVQVIYWEKDEGPLVSEHASYFDWLNGYLKDLNRGRYELNEFGTLWEKS